MEATDYPRPLSFRDSAKPVYSIEYPLSREYILPLHAPMPPAISFPAQLPAIVLVKVEETIERLDTKIPFAAGVCFLRQIALGNVKRACSIVPLFPGDSTNRVSCSISADQRQLLELPAVSRTRLRRVVGFYFPQVSGASTGLTTGLSQSSPSPPRG